MQVLSLFDGISCGQVALHRADTPPSIYYASEIDPNAISVTQRHHPRTIQLGCVKRVRQMVEANVIADIDLLMGGSPCQGFSRAGKGFGFTDPRSQLLFDFVAIKNKLKPRYFLLENVRMSERDRAIVSLLLGVEPVTIDSALFSAQRRVRSYWTNIPIAPIVDRQIEFMTVREWTGDHLDKYAVNRTPSRERMWANGIGRGNSGEYRCPNISFAKKSNTLTIKQDRSPNAGLIAYKDFCRYLTHVECERLQTLPDNYTLGLGQNARYQTLGNGWTVDVIAHILRGMQ